MLFDWLSLLISVHYLFIFSHSCSNYHTFLPLFSDNPYYFYNEKSPQTPDSNSKGFSFFKRRNSKGSSGNCSKITTATKCRGINSATLISDASVLGSPRGSLGSLASSPLCSPVSHAEINFQILVRLTYFFCYRPLKYILLILTRPH